MISSSFSKECGVYGFQLYLSPYIVWSLIAWWGFWTEDVMISTDSWCSALFPLCLLTAAEPWPSTSWCTTAAETSRVWRGSSGCLAPLRVSTLPRPALLLSTPQRSWTWTWTHHWSLLLGVPSPPGCRASWETSLTPTWHSCQTESPNSTLKHRHEENLNCAHQFEQLKKTGFWMGSATEKNRYTYNFVLMFSHIHFKSRAGWYSNNKIKLISSLGIILNFDKYSKTKMWRNL